MTPHRSLWQIFAVPLVIATVSVAGLISALVGDGWWDAVSWASLGLPVALYGIFTLRRQPR